MRLNPRRHLERAASVQLRDKRLLRQRIDSYRKGSFGNRRSAGFSLVEVVAALAMTSFAVIPMLGLMAVSLGEVGDTVSRGRAIESLRQAEAAIQAEVSVAATQTAPTYYQLGSPLLSGNAPITWQFGGATATYNFPVGESGEILSSGTGEVVLHVQLTPPGQLANTTLPSGPLRIYLTAAWPGTATYDQTKGWLNAKGFVESIFYLPTGG